MTVTPAVESDEDAIAACLDGDRDRFGVLVGRYQKLVFNLLLRYVGLVEEARDLSQDTFVSAFRQLSSYRGDARFSTWLCSIAVNKARDFLKRQRLHAVPFDEEGRQPGLLESPPPSPEAEAAARQTGASIQGVLNRMPDHYREVLLLKHVQGYEYEEMSAMLNESVGSLKVRTFRARLLFRSLYREANHATV